MEPGSRVELPPRGADLSFLSGNPETDTPSRWLTFNSTPNGNTTPGTAFGSPFWGSLNANGSTSAGGGNNGGALTGTGGSSSFSRNASGGGGGDNGGAHGNGSPKSYSPSKEFNPFELSFFPKHNEHLLASAAASSLENDKVKKEDMQANDEQQSNVNNSLRASLKRPFSEELVEQSQTQSSSEGGTAWSSSNPQSRPSTGADNNNSNLPSWKRSKVEDNVNNNINNASSQSNLQPSNTSDDHSSGSAYAPSPSTLNLNPSPDSGSPASSLIPTPSLQSALLPLGPHGNNLTNPNSNGLMANGVVAALRKSSNPPEQEEAAKLAAVGNYNAPLQVNIAQAQYQYQPQQQQQPLQMQHQPMPPMSAFHHSGITQSVPPPLSATFPSHQQQQQHQYGYQNYPSVPIQPPHMNQHHQQQQQQQQVILPPKTLQQQQAAQRNASPTHSNPPHSARQSSLDNNNYNARHASPGSNSGNVNSNNNHAIPYANGRGPPVTSTNSARPSRSTRSSKNNANRRGSTAPADIKEEDDNQDAFASGNENSLSATNTGTTAQSGKANSKKGKKGQLAAAATIAPTAPEPSSQNVSKESGKKGAAPASSMNFVGSYESYISSMGTGADDGIEDDEDGDDESKRKAFLERNRQAACRSRQKKKEWINNLETHAARLQSENQALTGEIDTLRKELFALRHTLSFHERSGCSAGPNMHHAPTPVHGNGGSNSHMPATLPPQQQQQQVQQPQQHQHQPPPMQQQQQQMPPVGAQQQQPPRPDWQRPAPLQQQQLHQPVHPGIATAQTQPIPLSHAQPLQQQQQQQPMGSHLPAHLQPPAIVQTQSSPASHLPHHLAHIQSGNRPQPVHIQTQPQPLTSLGAPTLAPSVLGGLNLLADSQQRAPPKLNLSPSSLQPQTRPAGLNQLNQLPSQVANLNGSTDIARPGSAGATFGLATPNFADLFNGAMGKLAGGNTPGFGAGLLFTPGGIMSSGGNFGGNSSNGYTMSPGLPNTFGLSMQDIPIRPASAPPTPSPALDNRLLGPSQDYFSSKNQSSHVGTSAAFADFLAAYPSNTLHASNAGSVVA